MAQIQFYTETLPAHFASALINNDCSGYTKEEVDIIEQIMHGKRDPVDVSDSYIGRYNGFVCEVADYTFIK